MLLTIHQYCFLKFEGILFKQVIRDDNVRRIDWHKKTWDELGFEYFNQ